MKFKKKVVFLGGSLPVLIFAYLYRKKYKNHKIIILDQSSSPGGAWQNFKYKNTSIRKQSNIVLSENKHVEKKHEFINNFLRENLGVKVYKIKKNIITKYKAKNQYQYNFEKFIKKIVKLKIIRKFCVKKIEILEKKIIINKKLIVDKIFFPIYFGLDELIVNNITQKINFKVIKSEHVIAIIKNSNFNNVFYADFLNDFFDRAEFIKHKNFFSFSARITRENKGSNKLKIKNQLKKIFGDNNLISFFKFKYKNYYRDKQNIEKLKKLKLKNKLEILDTRSFMISIQQIINYFK